MKTQHHRQNVRMLCRTALLCALLCILSVITVPVGAVPVTLGLLGVLLCGLLLPPGNACIAVFGYLLLGAVGLPVFSSMQGGIGVLFGITGGFLWGYPIAALLVSIARTSGRVPTMLGLLGAPICCYLLGTIVYCAVTQSTPAAALTACVLPFLIPDLCKCALAWMLFRRLRDRL